MKKKLLVEVEIETPDNCKVFPEEGQTDDDFKGKENELEEFRKEFSEDLHKNIINSFKEYLKENYFENFWLENEEEISIDGWESFNDYGIKFKTQIKKEE